MPSEQITNLFSDSIRAAIPDGSLKVSEWAERYRILPPQRADRSGPWSNAVTPHLREPMDEVTNPDVEEIDFMASAQIAKTEFLVNVAGYKIHIDPGPILYVAETEDKAQAWSKECFTPTVRVTPELRALVSEGRSRDSENTIFYKTFPGGHIAIVAATSPASLSSRPVRDLLLDECDAYKPTAEGDPVELAEKRTTTFFANRKIIKVTSPRDRETSTIEPAYLASDRRKYFVPCPHCGEPQVLAWTEGRCCCPKQDPAERCHLRHGFVKWDHGDPRTAYYVCFNGCEIRPHLKPAMLSAGRWIAERELRRRAGFFINELYSPFVTWPEMAEKFLQKKDDPESLKVFTNTSLAETWDPVTGQINIKDLTDRQESYQEETIPDEILILVAGIDIQRDRIELEIKGYGAGFESWGIKYLVLWGSPAMPEVWNELSTVLTTHYKTTAGRELRIAGAAIDSGDGVHTKDVYKFCRAHGLGIYKIGERKFRGALTFAIKGANTPGKPLLSKPTKQGRPPIWLYTIGTGAAKDSIAGRLEIKFKEGIPKPGACHFSKTYPEAYFQHLRSEKPVTRVWHGKAVRFWEPLKEGIRNEGLDCFVYAEAALQIYLQKFRVNLRQLQEKAEAERKRIEEERQRANEPPAEPLPAMVFDPTLDPDDEDEFTIKVRQKRGGRRFIPRKSGNFVTGRDDD